MFGNDAKDTGIPVEVWRYYLLAVRPETSDAAFQWDDFASKNNADLNDNLGNFVNRTLKFVFARFGGVVPGAAPGGAGAEAVAALGAKVSALVEQYIAGTAARSCRHVSFGTYSLTCIALRSHHHLLTRAFFGSESLLRFP